jgi:hypothetical protein
MDDRSCPDSSAPVKLRSDPKDLPRYVISGDEGAGAIRTENDRFLFGKVGRGERHQHLQ